MHLEMKIDISKNNDYNKFNGYSNDSLIKNMSNNNIQLFRNIALTFSGGGYRAACYSLGVLSYLNQVEIEDKNLLDHVKGLSTVSGGTITGAIYCTFRAKNIDFSEFFKHLYSFIDEDKLLSLAIDKMNDNKILEELSQKNEH